MKIKNNGNNPTRNIKGISNIKNRIDIKMESIRKITLMMNMTSEEENFIL
ncbi:MAG: hypothetical protein ACMXYB_02470 [Candidatus Woesearchaeota archaeon]